ncbi:hypothetical protein OsI_22615 [Oryza sativa Indica Group]|uniref:Uncharacterized protein n=1 Tax=Oryza sativa subsp. indica TaxID=39946 RepID=B8B0U4_ORYSI|nr:hypothetical protein OsI_22615 [Oryza sativa Indica Group]
MTYNNSDSIKLQCYITKVTFVNTFDLACPESVQDDDEKRQESEKSKMKAKQLDNIKPQGMKSQAGTNQICKLHKSMTEEIMKKKEQTAIYTLKLPYTGSTQMDNKHTQDNEGISAMKSHLGANL